VQREEVITALLKEQPPPGQVYGRR
jgi:hypothetical protein